MKNPIMERLGNQKGFAVPVTLYAIAALVIIAMLMGGYIKYQSVRIDGLKKDNQILSQANNGLQSNLEKERKACAAGISFYKEKLKECVAQQKPCEVVNITGCPTVKIIDKDAELEALKELWR